MGVLCDGREVVSVGDRGEGGGGVMAEVRAGDATVGTGSWREGGRRERSE